MYLIKVPTKERLGNKVRNYLFENGIKIEEDRLTPDWNFHRIYVDVSEEQAVLIKLSFAVEVIADQIPRKFDFWASSMNTGKSQIVATQQSGIHPFQSKGRVLRFYDNEATFKQEFLCEFLSTDIDSISNPTATVTPWSVGEKSET